MSPELRYQLLFIDDHPIYCDGMALALGLQMRNLKVHTAGDGPSARTVLDREDIDLVLCDYRLPGQDGITVIAALARAHPSVAVGLLCADLTPQLVSRARAVGAVACLSKERNVAAMADAVRGLLGGSQVFDVPPAPAPTPDHGLSAHRVDILKLAAVGLSNKEIAARLDITERTIKDHWTIIFTRLGVSNRVSALRAAHALRLIEFGDQRL